MVKVFTSMATAFLALLLARSPALLQFARPAKRTHCRSCVLQAVPAEAYSAICLASRGEIALSQEILMALNKSLGDVVKDTGFSPLFAAVKREDVKTLKWCLFNHCDPNDKVQGNTALHECMFFGRNIEMISVLLENSARVDAINECGNTPLMALADFSWSESDDVLNKASMLLDAGADPNKANALGETPLFLALERQNSKLALLLVENCANTELVSMRSSKSALDLLRERNDIETMCLLKDYLI